ncbi:MAG: hypothetical protein P8008_00580 [Gammaproteobacteria bacterium]
MFIPRLAVAALAVSLCLSVGAVLAQDEEAVPQQPAPPGVLELRQQANAAYEAGDYPAFRDAVAGLHELRPYNSDYMAMLVAANALAGDRTAAYNMMLKMQQQGLAQDFDKMSDTESIRGTEVYDYINDLLVRANEPLGAAEVVQDLPSDLLLATSIDWDPRREAWLVGDAREGAVRAVSRDGKVVKLLQSNDENGLWAIFGLLVDADNNRLWLSSSASEAHQAYDPVDAGRSALFEFTLDTLELVKRYPVPVDGRPHRLGNLVRTGSGDVYVADTILPILYRLESGGDRLRPFLASRDMVSMRGIALSDDDSKIYVADYELGVLVVDLAGKKAFKLAVPETLNMGGIEGLFYDDGYLVMIQNSNRPQRVMRLELNDNGTAVVNVAPLAVAQPFFDYPNFGTIVDDTLYFFANSHWVRAMESPQPIVLASTNVANAPDIVPPDLQKFREDYERDMRQRASAAKATESEAKDSDAAEGGD